MMNLADPELELVDPTPNVHTLFIHFDKEFFWTKLASRAVVRWSKRMYSCAGICSYEGRGGLCDIALSEPLLKLRPRKDLVETLLHEMIHAFLFVTNRDQDRDGHGPNFQSHMHRINNRAGLNISIYHSFHDEVHLYQTHWWRCDGPCQTRRPHFGIVRRSMNRAPGPSDYWWKNHIKNCGGTFVKIKEPENYKAKQKGSGKSNTDTIKKDKSIKSNGDITKYINNNIKTISNLSNTNIGKPVLKNSNSITITNSNLTKSNGASTFVVVKKGVIFNPSASKPSSQVPLFTGTGYTVTKSKPISDQRNVTEQVRSIWANKEIPTVINKAPIKKINTSMSVKNPVKIAGISSPNKQKAKDNIQSPPAKIKKIDDYFKTAATSVLKDLYGEDFKLTQKHNSTKLVAVSINQELVDCPTCNEKIDSNKINEHLDECLNIEIIKELSQDIELTHTTTDGTNIGSNDLVKVVGNIPTIPEFKGKLESASKHIIDCSNLSDINAGSNKINSNKDRRKSDSQTIIQSMEQSNVTSLVTKIDNPTNKTSRILDNKKPILHKIRKSDNFTTKDRTDNIFAFVKTESASDTSSNPEVRSESSTSKYQSVPSSSKDMEIFEQICPCCGNKFDKTVDEHLDECLVFSENNNTTSKESASNNDNNSTIVIDDDDDDDDLFDESQELNATGTKTPCPCCMEMVEEVAMNDHLDLCLGLSQP